jgi:NAD(P)-dependent dehydrogenase (short-subunit alcohol dehydrogenase family)
MQTKPGDHPTNNANALAVGSAIIGAALLSRAVFRSLHRFEFKDKVVLVTGGSRGLGLVLSRHLIRAGARVAICARDEEELHRAARELRRSGGRVFAIPCDVTDKAQVDLMIQKVQCEIGPVDVLINNAGIIMAGPVELMTIEDFEQAMDTHFWGPLYAISAVLPQMQKRRQGRIVNIASIGGKVSLPHLIPYNASKFALVGLSEGLRSELAKNNVRVTTVCPGLMRTGSHFAAEFKGQNRKEYAWFAVTGATSLTSLNVDRAARMILAAVRRGEAEVILSLQAQALEKLHALAPGLTADLLGVANRVLPRRGSEPSLRKVRGKYSRSGITKPLTLFSDRQAARNNELQV